ncbi:MAG: ABC transporter permease [Acidobacteria bacterium]|nr:ABC transporter permease [Acidobacteriota bacterium]
MPSLVFIRLVERQLRLLARDRQLVFWNFGFFLLLLVIFLGVLSGGDAAVRVTLAAALVTTGVMANALFTVAVGLTAARERGVFRRYWLTPTSPGLSVSAALCARAVMVFSAASLQVIVAGVVFGVPWSGGALSWITIAALGTSAFAAIGFAIASLAPAPHVANALANLVFIPMMALGGTALPASMMPEAWERLYWVLPTAAILEGLLGAFVRGEGVADNGARLGYLALWTVAPAAWAAYRWRRRGP